MDEERASEPAAGGHAPHHDEDLDHDHDHHVLGGNALMREVWDGEVGRFWVEETDRYEQMNAGFGGRLRADSPRLGGDRHSPQATRNSRGRLPRRCGLACPS
ncbi:hypothetical protein GCM10007231_07430 [Nocardioides daphniae]|uniref:Uncharacterized protein n=1 Tax=Nocardioides daphniae TaxID=402297 RepID=A0ABQ1Q3J7_9ACTN|nr:hypothetical protein GCM10007231_07430 [Nocardioides daphniae]